MLTNPLQRYSPYYSAQSSSLGIQNAQNTTGSVPSNGFNGYNERRSQYPLLPLQQYSGSGSGSGSLRSSHSSRHQQPKNRQISHAPSLSKSGTTSQNGVVRRRISRACDQCNQLRTKCDGQHPCAHCVEFGLSCEYARERKKRGKASRKDLAEQAIGKPNPGSPSPGETGDKTSSMKQHRSPGRGSVTLSTNPVDKALLERLRSGNTNLPSLQQQQQSQHSGHNNQQNESLDSLAELSSHQSHIPTHTANIEAPADQMGGGSPSNLDISYSGVHDPYAAADIISRTAPAATSFGPTATQGSLPGYSDMPYSFQTQNQNQAQGSGECNPQTATFGIATSPLNGYAMDTNAPTPAWMSLESPAPVPVQPPVPQIQHQQQQQQQQQHLPSPSNYNHHQQYQTPRYPVLNPVISHLTGIIPASLACDLIDLYFSSASSAHAHPMSPYVLAFLFRKRSFLHPSRPRRCQPALLASMLWVAAQTSDAAMLTSSPLARPRICQKLLELTVALLNPLIHTRAPMSELGEDTLSSVSLVSGFGTGPVSYGVAAAALGGLGVALPGSMNLDSMSRDYGVVGAQGCLDDVATYIHLATVVSASEYKGASIRWWNAAWSLARELKLGRELPPDSAQSYATDGEGPQNFGDLDATTAHMVSEEGREERRRIWWLVYSVDRHLALCYNRPLFLLDVECQGLLHPMDDTDWQNGSFDCYVAPGSVSGCQQQPQSATKEDDNDISNETPTMEGELSDSGYRSPQIDPSLGDQDTATTPGGATPASPIIRLQGPQFECTGHSIFGYFQPLMTILGEIVDLHHARNHPRFGTAFRETHEWDHQQSEIVRHLDIYERSLKRFERRHLPSPNDDNNAQQQEDSSCREVAEGSSMMDGLSSPSLSSILARHHNASASSTTAKPLSPSLPYPPSPPHSPHHQSTESQIQTLTVLSYASHLLHVLHVLLHGRWDPLALLDDADLWISSPGFPVATSHAVAAARAVEAGILVHDPGLEFMPFFFGIYLLQGSFLLLLLADKLQVEASGEVARACEGLVRAHEACCVTLSTEYQRNFSKVMRSALAQVRGRVPEDLAEQHQRRRELLALYRWTGDGTGLAL